MSAGSASELEYHSLLAHDLQLLQTSDLERLAGQAIEVKRMLASPMKMPRADS
jgi:four helix bundle protein